MGRSETLARVCLSPEMGLRCDSRDLRFQGLTKGSRFRSELLYPLVRVRLHETAASLACVVQRNLMHVAKQNHTLGHFHVGLRLLLYRLMTFSVVHELFKSSLNSFETSLVAYMASALSPFYSRARAVAIPASRMPIMRSAISTGYRHPGRCARYREPILCCNVPSIIAAYGMKSSGSEIALCADAPHPLCGLLQFGHGKRILLCSRLKTKTSPKNNVLCPRLRRQSY